eukprot:Skav225856  [mRNA]  locus=scaffold810:10784:27100:+ [translate_table: standard]
MYSTGRYRHLGRHIAKPSRCDAPPRGQNLRRVDVAQLLAATSPEDASVQQLRKACCEKRGGKRQETTRMMKQREVEEIIAKPAADRECNEQDSEPSSHHDDEKSRGAEAGFGSGSLASKRPEVKETFYCGEPPKEEEGIEAPPVERFYEELRAYHSQLLELSRGLLRGLSLALNLAPEHLEQIAFQRPVAKVHRVIRRNQALATMVMAQ